MLWDEKLSIISTKKRTKKINDQTKNDEKNQITIIACYSIKKILIKQRRLNIIETKNENFTVDNTTNEKNFAIINDETIKKINVVNIANNATNEKNINIVIVFDAINEKKQILLTNLL